MNSLPEASHASITAEVRYAETDQMGVVHHAVYPVWFELARTHLCQRTGFSYAEIEASGFFLLVTRLAIDYRQAARYPDQITTSCRLERLASRGLRFAYEVRRGQELLARGTTDHVWVEIATAKPCRVPERLAGPFASLLSS